MQIIHSDPSSDQEHAYPPRPLPRGIQPARSSNNAYGFPLPGPQSPTAAEATGRHYFVDDRAWQDIQDHGEFDDIVVGSGFCALAYIDEALKRDPVRRILLLERGELWLPDHFQTLPFSFKELYGPSLTFPWSLTSKTRDSQIQYLHGSCPFLGGRSIFWSAWCPRAFHKEWNLMRKFPPSIVKIASQEDFWRRAEEFLHVTPAASLTTPIFHGLQDELDSKLKLGIGSITAADFAIPAPLSLRNKASVSGLSFNKFSTPGPLLKIYGRQLELAKLGRGSPLMIATNTIAERFKLDTNGTSSAHPPIVLHTSRGSLCFPKAKTNIILAAGAIPNTTLLMNSVRSSLHGRAGSRLAGHFISHIVARFPHKQHREGHHLKIGASYIAGRCPENDHQYHIQITAIYSPRPDADAEDLDRFSPDSAATASMAQLEGSSDHIVLVCAALGELSESNPRAWVRHDPNNPDVTTNVKVQLDISDADSALWNLMEQATYDAINVMAADENEIEWWHQDVQGDEGSWQKHRPPQSQTRKPGVVHETSTLYMSDNSELDQHASVGADYRPRGCKNVYVTGGALFPSAGSWNPTLTICGLAQDLARRLVPDNQGK